MPLADANIDRLSGLIPGGYHPGAEPSCEPTAWASLALTGGGRLAEARIACDWLRGCQSRDGSVGVTKEQPDPGWPTSLAILAWTRQDKATGAERYADAIGRAVDWALATKGRTVERKPQIGHDTTLLGWSWAADTHAWLEPTCLFVRALQAAGHANHARRREAVRLVVDRLLPTGGANYGNTRVLDQYLLPHVQPTGLAMWALAGEAINDPRVDASLNYLQKSVSEPLGTASLAYAAMGLKAQGRGGGALPSTLEKALHGLGREPSTYKLALLTLAAQDAWIQ